MTRSRKLLLVVWLSVALGLGSVFFLYVSQSTQMMSTEVALSVMDTMAQIEQNLRSPLNSGQGLLAYLVANPDLREVLQNPGDPSEPLAMYDDYKKLSRLIRNIPTPREIARTRFFVDDRLSFSREHENFFGLAAIKGSRSYQQIVQRGSESFAEADGSWVTIYRQVGIGTPGPGEEFPILAVDLRAELFSRILSQSLFAQSHSVALLDQNRNVIASPVSTDIGKPVSSVLAEVLPADSLASILNEPTGIHDVPGKDHQITLVHRHFGDPDWTLVTIVNTPELLGNTRAYAVLLGLVIIVLVTAGLLFSVLLMTAIVTERTARKLRDISLTIESTGLAYFESNPERSDLGHLELAVAQLLRTSRTLVGDVYKAKEREQAARFSALQAQINPHFLYNTLDTINWMALRSGSTTIVDLVQALAKYFRYSLGHGEEIVKVEDEVELVRAYLQVQKARFGAIFEAEVCVPEELMGLTIPKLSLQPLVENALLHGLQNRRGSSGRLQIQAQKDGAIVRFVVRDNGRGMSVEQLQSVRTALGAGQAPKQSYGLWNVNERLQLYFGSGGLEFESEPGFGTTVTLSFPARPGPLNAS